MLDLDAIEARAEAATEGPWYEDDVTFGTGTLVIARFDDTVVQSSLPLSHTRTAPNADFIAHARTALPALVAELRAAREVVEAAPVAITLRTDEAFYGAMNRLADALAAYRAVVGPE